MEFRLKRKKKKMVSGFFSEEVANSAIARTLEVNRDKIAEWLENPSVPQTFNHDFGEECIGLVLIKGVAEPIEGSKVNVRLIYVPSNSNYWINTSYIDP